jgi:predicted dehydrogenase
MTLKMGFLGCGGFARRYHAPTLLEGKGARIAIICDPKPVEALREIAERAQAKLVSDVAALLEPGACDAVIVSTPHMLHAEHARAALEAGRHVLVDKPFVMRTEDADDLARRAAAKKLVGGVAFNRRLDRGCLRAREVIHSGALGDVKYIQTVQLGYERGGWFLDPALGGGGPFTGRGTHMADLIPWLLGQAPTRLRARVRSGPAGRADRGGMIELQFGELECHMTCVEEGWHMWDEVRIFGEHGLIELRRPLPMPIGWGFVWQRERGAVIEEIAAEANFGACTEDFIAAVGGRHPPACSFAEARVSVRIIEAAFASARGSGDWIAF